MSRGEDRQVLRQCAAVRGIAKDIRPQGGSGTNQQTCRAEPAKLGPVAENLFRPPQQKRFLFRRAGLDRATIHQAAGQGGLPVPLQRYCHPQKLHTFPFTSLDGGRLQDL